MMKVLIMSDTHGLTKEVEKVVRQVRAEHIIHCGDFCVDSHSIPFNQMILVRGNCDYDSSPPLQKNLQWQGLRVFVTHGHKYKVKASLLTLSYIAEENQADIVCFGHSHVPMTLYEKGRLFINPGSLSSPRGYKEPTFVILELSIEEQSFQVGVSYYNLSFEKKTDLGGIYKLI